MAYDSTKEKERPGSGPRTTRSPADVCSRAISEPRLTAGLDLLLVHLEYQYRGRIPSALARGFAPMLVIVYFYRASWRASKGARAN